MPREIRKPGDQPQEPEPPISQDMAVFDAILRELVEGQIIDLPPAPALPIPTIEDPSQMLPIEQEEDKPQE